jgi:hypothetical protein
MFRPFEHPMNIEEISAAASALSRSLMSSAESIREVLERSTLPTDGFEPCVPRLAF